MSNYKDIPDDIEDGRTSNSALGQRNRGALTRMSIDLTREEQKEFLLESVDHNMTLRGYFYHVWRDYQRVKGLYSNTSQGQTTPADLADRAVAKAKRRHATDV